MHMAYNKFVSFIMKFLIAPDFFTDPGKDRIQMAANINLPEFVPSDKFSHYELHFPTMIIHPWNFPES